MGAAATDTGEHKLLSYRVDQLEAAVGEIRDAVQSIDQSLRLLAAVEAQQLATRRQIEGLESRTRTIEIEIPTLKLIRQWVVGGVIGVVAAVCYAVLSGVVLR